MELKTKFIFGILLTSTLTACTANFSGGEETPAKPDRFGGKPRVAGPAVEGEWKSGCVRFGGMGSRSLTMTFEGENFSRNSEFFKDPSCQESEKKENYTGQFIFSENYADGATEISYAIALGSGITSFTAEKILLENGVLYVSDFVVGSGASVNRNVPMRKSAPAPECQNYEGSYQMNSEYFSIKQNACQYITWTNEARAGQPVVYVLDGSERSYNGQRMKASMDNKLFKLEYQVNGAAVVEKWSFQRRPCHLSNPSGEMYLTKNVWVNGTEDTDKCDYYAKYR